MQDVINEPSSPSMKKKSKKRKASKASSVKEIDGCKKRTVDNVQSVATDVNLNNEINKFSCSCSGGSCYRLQ
jgi:hypothetical protein